MALDRILLTHFRNHRETAIEGAARFNLLIGDNGAGKTNVLEAISLFAPGRGLRRAALTEMAAQEGDGGFAVSAELTSAQGAVRLGTGTTAGRPGRRIVQVNGAEAPALSLAEWLSIGWLTPAMDRLFVDSAGARRRFLDRLVLALRPDHARGCARLESAIRERNRLLAEPAKPEPAWLDAIEAQIADAGSAVAWARATMIAQLQQTLAALPEGPFARPALSYAPGGPIGGAELAATLLAQRGRDRASQRTLSGPHRDELVVTMAAKNQPAAECSTGEQKAMLIALVLAHSQILEDRSPDEARPRLLLLDEVAAHIDPLRREALFERLRACSAQVWLTGTERGPFTAIESEAAIWLVRDGSVERIK